MPYSMRFGGEDWDFRAGSTSGCDCCFPQPWTSSRSFLSFGVILKEEHWATIKYMMISPSQVYELIYNGMLYKMKGLKQLAIVLFDGQYNPLLSCYKERRVRNTGVR
jgi:hypothetical protein